MAKEIFEAPVMEIVKFASEDVITTSDTTSSKWNYDDMSKNQGNNNGG